MSLPVIIIGGSGHAKVLIEALRLNSIEIVGILDINPDLKGKKVMGLPIIGSDDAIELYAPDVVRLVNGVGSVRVPTRRCELFDRFKRMGFIFADVIHPSAIIASGVELGEGAQVMAGVVIQTGSRIGRNAIVNTSASVDHDCLIGEHSHIAPGVTLSGGVRVGDLVHIGTGATVVQGILVGNGSLVGAGTVVVNDVPQGMTVLGVPGKVVQK
jgi:UDP-perosamine 4-acetyltransferase